MAFFLFLFLFVYLSIMLVINIFLLLFKLSPVPAQGNRLAQVGLEAVVGFAVEILLPRLAGAYRAIGLEGILYQADVDRSHQLLALGFREAVGEEKEIVAGGLLDIFRGGKLTPGAVEEPDAAVAGRGIDRVDQSNDRVVAGSRVEVQGHSALLREVDDEALLLQLGHLSLAAEFGGDLGRLPGVEEVDEVFASIDFERGYQRVGHGRKKLCRRFNSLRHQRRSHGREEKQSS